MGNDQDQGVGSPFSLVLAQGGTDTTSETSVSGVDNDTESSIGVGTGPALTPAGDRFHVAGEDETPGDEQTAQAPPSA
jgi:hypothetical protein